MSKPVNVARWENLCREYGCVVTREKPVQIHHIKGRTFKHNKVLVGPWYILPLTPRLHDSRLPDPMKVNVTNNRKRFEIEHGDQKTLFINMISRMLESHQEIPVPEDVIWAVKTL